MRLKSLADKLSNLVHLNSFHCEWYLQALCLWRGSVFLLWSNVQPPVALGAMLVLSCACGYVSLNSVPELKLDETMGFLPYFALGYVFPLDKVLVSCKRTSESAAVTGILSVFWIVV